MNDHYHRPKREIIQKVMEAAGENPKECVSQPELDRRSELDAVWDTFLAIGLDPQRLELRLCNLDPPDCQAFNEDGNLVGWEVVGLYDQRVEEHNSGAKTIEERIYRDWTEDDLITELARWIEVKDRKIGKKKADASEWPFAYVNLVIPTDELVITREMADSIQGRLDSTETIHLRDVYLLLSYDPRAQDRPCIRLK